MAWTPRIKVPDLTGVVDNLLGYIRDNQADAHEWANGSPMKDYAALYPNAAGRLTTKFPQLLVIDQEHKGEEGKSDDGELLVIRLALTFEGAVTGNNADTLVNTAKAYGMALESMLVNIPGATLCAGMTNTTHGVCMTYQTVYDVLKGTGKTGSTWLQIWQTQVEYELTGEAL